MSSFLPGEAIVLFSTADWDWPYWTNKQHIASRLGARGFRVLYVETIGLRSPGLNRGDIGRICRRLGRALGSIREVQKNVWVLPVLTIPGASHVGFVGYFNDWMLRTSIKSWLRRCEATRPLVWTYHPYMLRVAKALDPRALIYHCVDNLGAVPGVDGAAFDQAERELITCSDQIFTTSPKLRDRCRGLAPHRTDYFGNVADIDFFASARGPGPIPADLAAIPQPRLGYVGVLSDFKTDFALIDATARAHTNWHFVFIGEEREGQSSGPVAQLRARPNVHFLGWKPYTQLPGYLRGIDVALLPQLENDYTRAMFPLKYFEYLAAGRPVVTTSLPALAGFSDLHLEAAQPESFAEAIASALSAPKIVAADHPVLRSHSWDARIDSMLRLIDARVGRRVGESANAGGDPP
jgi:glycosyltransferase involved in cell wall biosynthesis